MTGRLAGLILATMLSGGAAAEDGAALFEPCRACHSLDPATKVMPGPNLAGLIGRKVAGDPNFDYSPVLRAGRHPVVRIPVGRFDMASRALDFGAEAVIAPMVNSVADARLFAASMKYPPLGERSWGPTYAFPRHGKGDFAGWLAESNGRTVSFAMIETRAALDSLDGILGTPGIDAIFVGRPGPDGRRSVVAVRAGLRAWTGLVPLVRGSHGVLELPVGTIAASGTVVGDSVELAPR